MAIEKPYPELNEPLEVISEAGQRLSESEATAGAAGNISVYLGWDVEPGRRFPLVESIQLPTSFRALAHKSFLVTG